MAREMRRGSGGVEMHLGWRIIQGEPRGFGLREYFPRSY